MLKGRVCWRVRFDYFTLEDTQWYNNTIDITAALCRGEIRIGALTHKGEHWEGTSVLEYTLRRNAIYILVLKGVQIKDQVSTYIEMSLAWMWKKRSLLKYCKSQNEKITWNECITIYKKKDRVHHKKFIFFHILGKMHHLRSLLKI